MNISEIKRRSYEDAPYFFSRNTMRFFGQTMRDFRIKKQADGRYLITAPMIDHEGRNVGETKRFFNPANNKLEHN